MRGALPLSSLRARNKFDALAAHPWLQKRLVLVIKALYIKANA
jgi:hypothetical protein